MSLSWPGADRSDSAGARHLTVDMAWLRFADSAAIQALLQADHALRSRGGGPELLHPQPVVARTLTLLGIDQALEVRCGTGTGTGTGPQEP
jgi:anti-anti-sigma factor